VLHTYKALLFNSLILQTTKSKALVFFCKCVDKCILFVGGQGDVFVDRESK